MNAATESTTDSSEIHFAEGVIGVPRARRFQLLERPDSPVRILRCLDIEGFALPVIDPYAADPDYRPRFHPRVFQALGIESDDPVLVLAITSLEEDGGTANLRAPLVINPVRRRGAQVILDGDDYPVRVRVSVGRELATEPR